MFLLIYVTASMVLGGLNYGAGAINSAQEFDTLAQCEAAATTEPPPITPGATDPGWQCVQLK